MLEIDAHAKCMADPVFFHQGKIMIQILRELWKIQMAMRIYKHDEQAFKAKAARSGAARDTKQRIHMVCVARADGW